MGEFSVTCRFYPWVRCVFCGDVLSYSCQCLAGVLYNGLRMCSLISPDESSDFLCFGILSSDRGRNYKSIKSISVY